MKDAYRPTIRTNEPSDQRTFGTMDLRSKKPSEHREAPEISDNRNGPQVGYEQALYPRVNGH